MFKSESIRNLFMQNGWFEGRKVDVTPFLSFYKELDIHPCSIALNILKEFGGLVVKTPSKVVKSGCLTTLVINPSYGGIELEELFEFENLINQKLTTLGAFPRSEIEILVSESGEFYFAGNSEFLYFTLISNDFYEMLEMYFSKKFLDGIEFPNLYTEE
ncbi:MULTISPECIES: SUKH-3 domain-containing protein [Paenibacillus]|uniref:SUKH-3 domain-containing protein n=1 Tax=Paenibacillus TaxID=44249 RepID=UPI0003786EB5|nr:SUKH-3 domain-containing protein [Paenibacillus massiliensis]